MKTYKKIWNVVLIAAVALVAGCSDGELRFDHPAFNISPPSPFIVSFQASPDKIKQGESTVISWEVANADSIEITSRSADGTSPVHVESKDLTGSVAVNNLTMNTDLTLTAKLSSTSDNAAVEGGTVKALSISAKPSAAQDSGDPASVADESSGGAATAPVPASETITVEVTAVEKLAASITVDNTEVARNGNTIIRWSVTPADATVSVTDSDMNSVSPTFAGDDCSKTDPNELLDSGTPTEQPAAVGCAVVTVAGTTVYTVTATDADGANAVADVRIEVPEVNVTAEISVNGKILDVLQSYATPVDVSWNVSPKDSAVTVTASPSANCVPALPNGQVVDYSSAKCTVSANTQFKVHAEIAGDPTRYAEAVARVERGVVTASAEIGVRADEWAFEGETVSVDVYVKEGSDASAIKEVLISDADSASGVSRVTLPLSSPVRVVVPRDGVKVTVEDVSGGKKEQIAVRTMATSDNGISGEAVTAVSFAQDDPKTRFYGVRMAGYNDGITKIYVNGADKAIDFGDKLATAVKMKKFWKANNFEKYVQSFQANTIVSRPGNPSEIYAGITGAVMRSKDAGTTWDVVAPALRISKNGKDYDGSHPTCRGATQTGVKAYYKNQPVSLDQICDLQVTKGGRVVIGTDKGAFVIVNVEEFIAKKGIGVEFYGRPAKKETKSNHIVVHHPNSITESAVEDLAYGHVVDDVECVDEECGTIFAASDMGVIRSEDGGKSWATFGSIDARPYKLTIVGETIYAATDSGVFSAGLADPIWKDLGLGKKTMSIAVAGQDGIFGKMIIAGTSAGAYITRDSGKTWSAISSLGEAASEYVALSSGVGANGGNIVSVLLSGDKKVTFGQTLVNKLDMSSSAEDIVKAMTEAGIEKEILDAYTQ